MTCSILAQSIRWVWITALGVPVVPEVNMNLATVSGPVAARAVSTASVAAVSSRPCQSASGPVTPSRGSQGKAALIAGAKAWRSSAKTAPGVIWSRIPCSLEWSCEASE